MTRYIFPFLGHRKMTPVPIQWAPDIIIIGATTPTTPTTKLPIPGDIASLDSAMNSVDGQVDTDGEPDALSQFFTVWAVVVVLLTLAVVTMVSNSTILTMFVLRKSVRRCKNIYIASLAAADLGIGLTLPLAALEQVEHRWVLEGVACHLYQTVRCSLLYVSLLSILLITLDRWWSIHYPFTYRVRQSKKMAAVAVAMVWMTSFALHVPPVLLWDYVVARPDTDVITLDDHVHDIRETLSSGDDSMMLSSLSSSSSLLSVLTTTTPFSSLKNAAGGQEASNGLGPESRTMKNVERTVTDSDSGRCELPYNRSFSYVLTASVVLYFFPLLALWILNCSLYFKITRRKSIKIRRSLSVTDNHLLAFRKSSSESESSPNNGGESEISGVELRKAEHRQRLVATSRAGRRHTLAFPGHQFPRLGGSGAGSVYYPSQSSARFHSSRRISLHEAFSGIGNMAAVAGAVPHLPRVNSCGRVSVGGVTTTNGSIAVPGFGFGSGHRHSMCSTSRKQSEDLVKELLVRQDKKAARLLGLLVTVFTLCWLPYTVVAVLHSSDSSAVAAWFRDLSFWVLVTNSAINPFLYGLLNAEFRKILRDWFYFSRQSNYRLKHALLYWSLPPNGDSDGLKEAPIAHGLFATSIKE